MSEVRPKHVPERTCVACRKKRPQGEMIRFCRDPQGVWLVRLEPKRAGRGAYLCADDPTCWQEKRLRRTFGAQAPLVAGQLAALHALRPGAARPLSVPESPMNT